MERGYYEVKWDGRDSFGEEVCEGIYFYKLQVGKVEKVRKTIYTTQTQNPPNYLTNSVFFILLM
jgi:flagellar hook assembly protein FlgD